MTFRTSRPPPGWFQCGLCLSELFLMMKETIQTERYESLEKVEPVTYLEWHLTVHIILLRSNDNIFFFFLFFRVNFPPHLPSPSWQLLINENIYEITTLITNNFPPPYSWWCFPQYYWSAICGAAFILPGSPAPRPAPGPAPGQTSGRDFLMSAPDSGLTTPGPAVIQERSRPPSPGRTPGAWRPACWRRRRSKRPASGFSIFYWMLSPDVVFIKEMWWRPFL